MNTENWNEVTLTPLSQAVMHEYDGLVGLTLLNLYNMSVELGVIRLFEFNPKSKEHIYILRLALMARAIYRLPVEVELNRWELFKLNWKLRRGFDPIHKISRGEYCGIWVDKMLESMRPEGIQRLGEDFSFADIYEAYYEGSCD